MRDEYTGKGRARGEESDCAGTEPHLDRPPLQGREIFLACS